MFELVVSVDSFDYSQFSYSYDTFTYRFRFSGQRSKTRSRLRFYIYIIYVTFKVHSNSETRISSFISNVRDPMTFTDDRSSLLKL